MASMENNRENTPGGIEVRDFAETVIRNVEQVIVGKRSAIELVLVALLCEGHVLIEDAPGTGKTMLARSVAVSTGLEFKRLQCTPDLLPGDVTGVSVFNQKTREFEFKPGPVFANVLLADEINRATPRTQSALLEALGEGQVTLDGVTYPLPRPFLVLATQNPIEFEGVFPLPEAQLDRFFIRLSLGYPALADEDAMLQMQQQAHPIETLTRVVDGNRLPGLQRQVRQVQVAGSVRRYILDLVRATREHPALGLGASPRASLALFRAAQAHAALRGRDFALPDDVKASAVVVLAHRMMVKPESLLGGETAVGVLRDLLEQTEVPLAENGKAARRR
ncbi:MAG: MoxR family ATPase [Chloroflexota bacterium]